MNREITCTVCPLGCRMRVCGQGEVLTVTGNTCRRGEAYAIAECTAPMRTLTTTVRLADGRTVAVKTEKPIAKQSLHEAMRVLRDLRPSAPVRRGEVLIEDLFGASIVATGEALEVK